MCQSTVSDLIVTKQQCNNAHNQPESQGNACRIQRKQSQITSAITLLIITHTCDGYMEEKCPLLLPPSPHLPQRPAFMQANRAPETSVH